MKDIDDINEVLTKALPIYLEIDVISEKINDLYAKRRHLHQKLNDLANLNFGTEEEFTNYLYRDRDGNNFYLATLEFDEMPIINFCRLKPVNFSPSHIVDEVDED